MQYVIYYPAAHGPMRGPLVEDAAEAARIAEADPRRPMALTRESFRGSFSWHRRDHVAIHVTGKAATRTQERVKFSVRVSGEKRSAYWGCNLEIAFPRQADAPLSIRKLRWTGKCTSVSAAEFDARLPTVIDGLCQVLDGGALGALVVADGAAKSASRSGGMARLIGEAATAQRSEEQAREAEMARRADAHAARLNLAPDGTPLVVRGGLTARHQKLGIKRGTVPKALAAHARVATKEDLEDPVLKSAGVSRHVALFMLARAGEALAADPSVARFGRDPDGRYQFHPTTPFHASYSDTEAVRERRKAMPAIWISTADPGWGRSATIDDTNKQSWRQATGSTRSPNFPGGDDPYRPSILRMTRHSSRAAFRDAEMIASILTFSEGAARVIGEHEIGAAELNRVEIVAGDGSERWLRYVPVFREGRASVLTGRCPSDLVANLSGRAVLDYELVVDADAHGDLDLWHDTSLRGKRLLFSGRLMRALKKAGISIGMAPKKVSVE